MCVTENIPRYVYNPLKLPLGWDGKPIPYWLYKLHGLNMEFKCEICGNYRCGRARVFGICAWGLATCIRTRVAP